MRVAKSLGRRNMSPADWYEFPGKGNLRQCKPFYRLKQKSQI